MLRIRNLKSQGGSGAAVAGYLFHQQQPGAGSASAIGYYQAGAHAPVAWYGRLAGRFGLEAGAEVEQEKLVALLEGVDPSTGETFASGHGKANRRMGVDMSFSAPKSVSVAALALGDDRLIAAHDQAVREALDFIEREYSTARFGRNGVEVRKTGSILAAVARHEDARTVDGIADPDLHSHAVVANVTAADGQLRGLDFSLGQKGVHLAGAVYRASLARQAQELGYQLVGSQEGFELVGIDAEAMAVFSRRSTQIEKALMEQFGVTRAGATEAQKRAVVEFTRGDKTQLGQADQHQEWHERAAELGLDLDALVGLPDQDQPPTITDDELSQAIQGLSERDTIFSRDALRAELLAETMAKGVDLTAVDAAIDRLISDQQLLDLGEIADDSKGHRSHAAAAGKMLMSRRTLETENQIIAAARSGRDQAKPLTDQERAATLIEQAEAAQGFKFSPDQAQAFKHALISPDQVTAVEGSAGVGKTTMLKPLAAFAASQGYALVGVTTAAAATGPLGEAIPDARTLASFLAAGTGDEPQPRLIVLDEAGMVGASSMRDLLGKLRPQDRLLMVGDSDQLSAVETGLPFYQMIREGAVLSERNTTVVRQRQAPKLLRVVQAFADRDPERAVDLAQEFVKDVPVDPRKKGETQAEVKARKLAAMVRAAADNYVSRSAENRAGLLVMAGTRAGVSETNAAIRERLIARGELGQDRVEIQSLSAADMTTAQQKSARHYQKGMVIRYSERGQRSKPPKAISLVVDDVDLATGKLLVHPESQPDRQIQVDPKKLGPRKPRVYLPPARLELRVGDKVAWTSTDRVRDEVNGRIATVTDIHEDGSASLRMPDGKIRKLGGPGAEAAAVAHGYCSTVHKAQGQTVDGAIVVGDATSAELAYVAMSRAKRDDVKVYVVDRKQFSGKMTRWGSRQTARSLAYGLDDSLTSVIRCMDTKLQVKPPQQTAQPQPPQPTKQVEIDRDAPGLDL